VPKSDLISAKQTTSETFRKWLECKVIVWKCVACVKVRPNIGWTSNLQNFLKSTWVATQKIVFKGSGSWRGVDTNRRSWCAADTNRKKFDVRQTQIDKNLMRQTRIDKYLTSGRHKLTRIWRVADTNMFRMVRTRGPNLYDWSELTRLTLRPRLTSPLRLMLQKCWRPKKIGVDWSRQSQKRFLQASVSSHKSLHDWSQKVWSDKRWSRCYTLRGCIFADVQSCEEVKMLLQAKRQPGKNMLGRVVASLINTKGHKY